MSRFVAALAFFVIGAFAQTASADDSMAPVPSGLLAKWRMIQVRMADDAARLAACRVDSEACSIEDKKLQAFVDAARAREGRARIGEVNRAVNLAIRPDNDLRRFGVMDYWSAPLQTLQAGAGDCEDYAILKFLVLREAGLADDELRLVIVHDAAAQQDHAVLAVKLQDRWLVLDNRRFALAEMRTTRYRVLAQLSPDGGRSVPVIARVADMAAPAADESGFM